MRLYGGGTRGQEDGYPRSLHCASVPQIAGNRRICDRLRIGGPVPDKDCDDWFAHA